MKYPLSKQVTEHLLLPFAGATIAGVYIILKDGADMTSLLLASGFGLPVLYLLWPFFDKRVAFKNAHKVSKADALFVFPVKLSSALRFLELCTLFIAGGMAIIIKDNNLTGGLYFLVPGLVVMVLLTVAAMHPKIRFKDSENIDDLIASLKAAGTDNILLEEEGDFDYGDDWFSIQIKGHVRQVFWNDITLVRTYKIDAMTIDYIVVEIEDTQSVISINDETPGFYKFMAIAESKLEGFKQDWFQVVAFPAFETNLTIIYEKGLP